MSEENSVLDTETTSDNTISSQNGFYLVAKKETVENEVSNTKCRQTKPSTDNIIVWKCQNKLRIGFWRCQEVVGWWSESLFKNPEFKQSYWKVQHGKSGRLFTSRSWRRNSSRWIRIFQASGFEINEICKIWLYTDFTNWEKRGGHLIVHIMFY